jgi:hypothetical protein
MTGTVPPVTTPDQTAGRPVPDTDDLRLLAEIINNGSIGLPQAAWNARMSQPEAAARFVTMAERGMPLRLVAEGDRQLLWQIAQAGPATGGVALPAPAPDEAPAAPPIAPVALEPQPVQQLPVAPPPPPLLPAASAVPPHEQAIAGAVPLGQPPFGTPPPADTPAAPDTEQGQAWGDPGIAPGARTEAPGEMPPRQSVTQEPPAAPPASSPTRRVMISGPPTQEVTGLFGEHLSITLQQILDPADQILTQSGHRLDPGQRALLVQTAIVNQGGADFESLPDLYLVLVSGTGAVLEKAAMAVAQFPAHRVGLPAGANASGWTVFLVPAETEVAEVRWRVHPDQVDRTVSWGFGPA